MRLDGVLFFPVTPYGTDGDIAEQIVAEHVAQGVAAGAGGVFTACGTGEFNALDLADYTKVVAASVTATGGRVPVFAGAGGPLPTAKALARAAADNGADGLLLMPPYLVTAPPDGLVRYVREVASAGGLPVIIYQRGTARFSPSAVATLAQVPEIIGFKDGLGDFDLLQRIILTVRRSTDREFTFFNGLPTAELTVPAYRGLGVTLYSSAVFAFAPEIALAFHKAVTGDDEVLVQRLLTDFYLPLVELRDRVPGYAVSLVKAGVRLRGLEVGGVRAPLVDPSAEDLAELERILAIGLEIAGA
ncbi:5-dehydro-4-deoxyglucarate dehydratase [Nonomuraea sp. NEAU-A123]|uniref:5-dehydro-4-deoxyglucarate dehydratase n=1 Tax=Nonomuraea sp. NEAU-A123 TaxID=2839649 RepID=UPI001BE49059|nr:5-dehydro-4-deoxyglucarate dehydratase [Nonomuraea sp. NEAU-A123]MBT2235747.1 5-dehydro-4-deoxyglucarate dehydratase [Nonomuraea sp. NEAU-A123]